MAEQALQLTATSGVCRRCCLPDDLLPIQQAAVIRSLPPAYAAVAKRAGANDPLRRSTPEGEVALEHAAYVGAMFAAVYIRLHQLLRRDQPEQVGLVVERPRPPGEPNAQLTLSRLSDQAERVAQTIMTAAPRCDWQAPLSHEQASPHALVHQAIDEAAEHLRDAGSVLLLDAKPLAVAGPGLFLKGGFDPERAPDIVAWGSGVGEAPGGLRRRLKERSR